MKFNIATVAMALLLPATVLAQDSLALSKKNSYTPFKNSSKRFNDWAISAGAGIPIAQSGDLTSIKESGSGKNLFGWSAYISIDKAITHAFGLKLQYDKGESRQGWGNTKDHTPLNPKTIHAGAARTQYDALSLLGDINFSNLLRRVDNHSPFRWAFHGYVGGGLLAYKAYRQDPGLTYNQKLVTEIKPFNFSSMFLLAGAGIKYRATKSLDLEVRGTYMMTGDRNFDGSQGAPYQGLANDNPSANLINMSLGVTYNIGKHQSHLFWHDPLQETYYKLDVLASKNPEVETCKKGDNDNDGVCDDWDKQLDTPAGARVDGSGVALDSDMDRLIDLNDKCVTVPGPASNQGCPIDIIVVNEKVIELGSIQFDLNSDIILPGESTQILNQAVTYINSSAPGIVYTIIGATDTRATEQYNQKLSERRAESVRKFLIENGVDPNRLRTEGHGELDLKYTECNPASKCPEWKNRANRRVYFKAK